MQPRSIHFTAVLMALAIPAFAGETPPPASAPAEAAAPTRPPGFVAFAPGYLHQFEADLDGPNGSFSADRWRLDAGTRIPFSDALTVSIGAETEWSRYDFAGPRGAGVGLVDDSDDLFVAQLGALAFYDLNDTWQVVAGGTISWGGDFDASFSDGLGGSGLLGVTYRFSPKFSLTPGVLALARLEDDALVVPVLGLDWEIADDWRLRSIGPGAELTWQAADEWGFFLRGLYRPRDFRLAEDATVPSGVLRERAFPVSLGIEWKPSERVTATVFGGAILGGQLRLTEEDGGEVLEENFDVTPILGGTLRVFF
jgi:hypothetical protein